MDKRRDFGPAIGMAIAFLPGLALTAWVLYLWIMG